MFTQIIYVFCMDLGINIEFFLYTGLTDLFLY
jgi:hypothetical protein